MGGKENSVVHLFPKLRLGMGQMPVEGGKYERNLQRAEAMIREAHEAGCQAIVLPECLDTGWTHPSARELAQTIPGETSDRLCGYARTYGMMIVAGLTELDNGRIYNSAILVDETGRILLKHRKINVLPIEDLYNVGNMLSVAETRFGTIGVNICADSFVNSLAIGHVQARMGAHFIFSPSAWAVEANHDNTKQPYGEDWKKAYTELCRLYGITMVGVSNVGWLTDGPWKGRKVIGCSLAMGPDGKIISCGPYGSNAESLITATLEAKPRNVKGTEYSQYLREKGYEGP